MASTPISIRRKLQAAWGPLVISMFRGNIVEMGTVEEVLMAPKHPYTQLLRDSIPEADPKRRWQGKVQLSDLDQDEYLQQGCRFAGRCPHVMPICRTAEPSALQVEGVLVKCYLYSEEKVVG